MAADPGAPAETWPHFAADEVEAAAAVLRSGRVNQWTGDRVRAFEAALASACGMRHAVALANGSLALEVALRAFGIGPGDEVIVTCRSFIASASCVDIVGARPVFADVDPRTQNITAETIAPCITSRTKAIIPVHLAGWPCDMPQIMALAARHGLIVIEDCAQAIGARVDGRQVGTFGHAAAFSFCQDKIITTAGEGGALLTDDDRVWRWAWSYKDHGKDYDLATTPAQTATSAYRWLHGGIGTNLRLTEMQAAVGLVQLGKLSAWLSTRATNAEAWRSVLGRLDCLDMPVPEPRMSHAWYKFYGFVRPERLAVGQSRDTILQLLNANGIRAFYGSCPEIYREKAYAGRNEPARPNARKLGETSLMFEVHPTLRAETIRATAARVVELVAPLQRG